MACILDFVSQLTINSKLGGRVLRSSMVLMVSFAIFLMAQFAFAGQGPFYYTLNTSLSVQDLPNGKQQLVYSPNKNVRRILVPAADQIRMAAPDESPFYEDPDVQGKIAKQDPIIEDYLVFVDDEAVLIDRLGNAINININPHELVAYAARKVKLPGKVPGKDAREYYVISTLLSPEGSSVGISATWIVDLDTEEVTLGFQKYFALNSYQIPRIEADGKLIFMSRDGKKTPTNMNFFEFEEKGLHLGGAPISIDSLKRAAQIAQGEASGKPQGAQRKLEPWEDPNPPKLVERKMLTAQEVRDAGKSIEDYLGVRVKGQPEWIEKLKLLQMSSLRYGRKETQKLLLMGFDNTGKGLLARTFVDAIHKREGAFREHLFEIGAVTRTSDLQTYQGSPTGYKGSEALPQLIRFLVRHSAGRYYIDRVGEGGKDEVVKERPEWKPGMLFEGYELPENGVLHVKSLELWAKKAKDEMLVDAIKNGKFRIKNPGQGGIGLIEVPVTIIAETTEGSNLLYPRNHDGRPLNSEKPNIATLMRIWENVKGNMERLKRELFRTNSQQGANHDQEPPGSSENFAKLWDMSNMLLSRPMRPEVIQEIINSYLEELALQFEGRFRLVWSPEVKQTLQEFEYDAEENAAPLKGKFTTMVADLLTQADLEGKIPEGPGQKYFVNFRKRPNNTLDLVLEDAKTHTQITFYVQASESQKIASLKTDEEMADVLSLGQRMRTQVIDHEDALDHIAKRVAVQHELKATQTSDRNARPANIVFALGPSSNGKTETFKALGRMYLGNEAAVVTIDCSKIKSMDDLKDLILGKKVDGRDVPSKFMSAYDGNGGEVIVILDEITNVPLDVLKGLYDIFREPVVRTFVDGVPRRMGGVFIAGTGNASEEWYKDIPRDVPVLEQQLAFETVFRRMLGDPDAVRSHYERFFSEALLNRIHEENISTYGPLTFKGIREVAILKLNIAIKNLREQAGVRNWDIKFASQREYLRLVEAAEENYVLREQGASLEAFARNMFEYDLRYFLLKNHVPPNATVVISRLEDTPQMKHEGRPAPGHMNFAVKVAGMDLPVFTINKRIEPDHVRFTGIEQIETGWHEAGGHELNRKLLFGDKYEESFITIIPGVEQFGGRWLRYLGLASHEKREHMSMNYEVVIREMAVLSAGHIAQELITKGGVTDAGKRNDMERATELAEKAILSWGVTPFNKKYSVAAMKEDEDPHHYIANWDAEKKRDFRIQVDEMVKESQNLARAVILTNFEIAMKLSNLLIEKGKLDREQLRNFYTEHANEIDTTSFQKLRDNPRMLNVLAARWSRGEKDPRSVDPQLYSSIERPKSIANIDLIVRQIKDQQIGKINYDFSNVPVASEHELAGVVDHGPVHAASVSAIAAARARDVEMRRPLTLPATEKKIKLTLSEKIKYCGLAALRLAPGRSK